MYAPTLVRFASTSSVGANPGNPCEPLTDSSPNWSGWPPAIHEAREHTRISPTGTFQRGFFAKLVPNVRKLGLLDANDGYLRRRWAEDGLLEFEFADDTASDYDSYDAVAADRALA